MTNLQTRNELEQDCREARAAMLTAWSEQSVTTAEEGASFTQAQEAIKRAKAAQAHYYECVNALEQYLFCLETKKSRAQKTRDIITLAEFWPGHELSEDEQEAEDYRLSVEPLGGW